MVSVLRLALVALLTLLAVPGVARAAGDCADLIPPGGSLPARKLVPEDLVRLRDIGPVDPAQQYAGLFAVSPDGARAAFQIRRADPANNSFCLAMVVADLRAEGRMVVVDRGGEFMRLRYDFRGKASFPSGFTDPVTPRWSPDGKWIVYRRRDKGAVQLWRARSDGSGSEAITDSIDSIDDFRIIADGRGIVYATRPALREALAAIDREGLSGFHYDDRFSPASSNRPFAPAPIARTAWVLDLGSRTTRAATPAEAALLDKMAMQEGSWTEAQSASGERAWLKIPARTLYPSRGRLAVTAGTRTIACAAPECADASFPWWVRGRVRFMRREGWDDSATAIYEWRPGARNVRRLYVTEDLLLSCVPTGEAITCLREASRQPRRQPAQPQPEIRP